MRVISALTTEHPAHRSHLTLGREPEGVSAPRETIGGQTARLCLEQFGESLEAIVLTGSLARNEATFVAEEQGCRLLGDAEFLLIFHAPASLPSKVALSLLRQNIEGSLSRLGIVGEVHLSAAHAEYLSKLRPHIFAYELRNCGHVVCGDSHILARILGFSVADIPLEDGWHLLSNRMIEQLEVLEGLEQGPKILPRHLFYSTIKLYLDMATSFLLFAGEYAPSYRERARRLRILAETRPREDSFPFNLQRFCERVAECTRWKLSETELHSYSLSAPESGADFSWWEEAVAYARLLWRWELAHLTRTAAQANNRELLERRMKSQPASRRLRGWLYVLRHQGWHRSWRNWPRWARLARKASPRYWIYASASELFFQLPSPLEDPGWLLRTDWSWEAVLQRLPVADRDERGLNGPCKPSWRQVARTVAWNYREFLEGTCS